MAAPIITAYLVDETWLKSYTPINANLDIKLIVPFIRTAQDLWIQPRISSAQYTRLMEGIVNNDLTSDETLLLEMLRPAVAYYTVYEAIPFIYTQIRNAGVVRAVNPNTENASMSEMKMLRTELENKGEFYMKRVLAFLCENSSLYPLVSNGEDMTSHKNTPYTGGFYFGGDCGCDSGCGCNPIYS